MGLIRLFPYHLDPNLLRKKHLLFPVRFDPKPPTRSSQQDFTKPEQEHLFLTFLQSSCDVAAISGPNLHVMSSSCLLVQRILQCIAKRLNPIDCWRPGVQQLLPPGVPANRSDPEIGAVGPVVPWRCSESFSTRSRPMGCSSSRTTYTVTGFMLCISRAFLQLRPVDKFLLCLGPQKLRAKNGSIRLIWCYLHCVSVIQLSCNGLSKMQSE